MFRVEASELSAGFRAADAAWKSGRGPALVGGRCCPDGGVPAVDGDYNRVVDRLPRGLGAALAGGFIYVVTVYTCWRAPMQLLEVKYVAMVDRWPFRSQSCGIARGVVAAELAWSVFIALTGLWEVDGTSYSTLCCTRVPGI